MTLYCTILYYAATFWVLDNYSMLNFVMLYVDML